MKQLFAFLLIFISFEAISQVSPNSAATNQMSWSLCINPTNSIKTTDSIVLKATLSSTNLYSNIVWKDTVVASGVGGKIALPTPTVDWLTGVSATSHFTLKNLAVGTYTFTATGIDQAGVSGSVSTVITVTAPPALRTLTGGTFKMVNGVLTVVPVYSDGQP